MQCSDYDINGEGREGELRTVSWTNIHRGIFILEVSSSQSEKVFPVNITLLHGRAPFLEAKSSSNRSQKTVVKIWDSFIIQRTSSSKFVPPRFFHVAVSYLPRFLDHH